MCHLQNPHRVSACQVLQAQEMTKTAPTSRDGLHPLMIPLAKQESQHGTVYTGLLRQVSLAGSDKVRCLGCLHLHLDMVSDGWSIALQADGTFMIAFC